MKNKTKTVIITGANKGIGLATTKKFLNENYKVIFCSRLENQKVYDLFQSFDDKKLINIEPVHLDLEKKETIINAAEIIKTKNETIEGLINNAGTIQTNLFLMSKIEDIKNLFELNYFSMLLFTQLISKIFIKQKSGSIVNLSSTASQDPIPGRLAYSAIKSAIDISSKILSKELSAFNVRVNCVAPGLTDTDLMNNNHTEKNIEETIKKLSIKRLATPAEIAELIFFLISKNSSYITGQVIRVDGGI